MRTVSNKKLRVLQSLSLALLLAFLSCSEDEPNKVEPDEPDRSSLLVTNLSVFAIGESGNASDIQLSFDAPENLEDILEFRIVILKSEKEVLSAEEAENLTENRYFSVAPSNDDNYNVTLPEVLLDSDGDDVGESIPYKLIVISLVETGTGTDFLVSESSTTFLITNVTKLNVQNIEIFAFGEQGSAGDIVVSFDGAEDAERIAEYRIIILKTENETISTEEARVLGQNQYQQVTNLEDSYTVRLSENQSDADGDEIMYSQAYVLVIVSVLVEDEFILSGRTSEFVIGNTLELKASSIEACDIRDANNSSDLDVMFAATGDNVFVDGFRIFVVKSSSASSFDLDIAKNVPEASYTFVSPGETQYKITLNDNLSDTDGDLISENIEYRIGILTLFSSGSNGASVLSDLSEPFELKPFDPIRSTTLASFNNNVGLDGMDIDSQGNIYVSNYMGNNGREVFKITSDGTISTFALLEAAPGGLVVDSQDNVIVMTTARQLQKISPVGEVSLYAEGTDFAGLTRDPSDNVYATGWVHPNLLKIDPTGRVDTIATDDRLRRSAGIVYNVDNNTIYTGQFNDGKIYQITMQGEVTELTDLDGGIGYLTEMNGNMYATLHNRNTVIKVSFNGESEVIAGSGESGEKDGPLLDSRFNEPNGITGDSQNNLLIINDANDRVITLQL